MAALLILLFEISVFSVKLVEPKLPQGDANA
jgi:Sec-independent protein secretion pathway component TatC